MVDGSLGELFSQRDNQGLKHFLMILGIPAALVAFWAATDQIGIRPVISGEIEAIEQRVAANASNIDYITWWRLDEKAKAGTITPDEQRIYCALSNKVGRTGVGC